jgi:hypothetical protein
MQKKIESISPKFLIILINKIEKKKRKKEKHPQPCGEGIGI